MTCIAARERKLRRKLTSIDLRLEKTPPRHWTRKHYGVGYQIIDRSNMVRAGCCQREFELTLEEAEYWAGRFADIAADPACV